MQVIGILGGVASGKSLVARLLAEAGAAVLDADRAGHAVLKLEDVKQAARERWGPSVVDRQGEIDRGAVARRVFAPPPDGPRERAFLEQLTHPKIRRLLQQEAEALASAGCGVAVLDAPLLLEAGWDRLCDKLVFVEVPRDIRLARATGRGWTEEEFAAREDAQLPADTKRARADLVLDNAGSPEATRDQVRRLWEDLRSTRT